MCRERMAKALITSLACANDNVVNIPPERRPLEMRRGSKCYRQESKYCRVGRMCHLSCRISKCEQSSCVSACRYARHQTRYRYLRHHARSNAYQMHGSKARMCCHHLTSPYFAILLVRSASHSPIRHCQDQLNTRLAESFRMRRMCNCSIRCTWDTRDSGTKRPRTNPRGLAYGPPAARSLPKGDRAVTMAEIPIPHNAIPTC